MSRALLLVLSIALTACSASSQDVPRHDAAIASAHPLATAAGYEVLEAGGNAFDAAIAVAAALSVVEPYSSGLGGGGFYLLHRASDGAEVFVDGRETAPLAATPAMYLDEEGEPVFARMREGALAAGIPGTPAALTYLAEHYGRLTLAESVAPAIRLAQDGFAVDARFVTLTERAAPMLRRYGTSAFFVDGRVPQVGEKLRQPELASTLAEFASDGGASFYIGATAARLVSGVQAAGGIWALEDLAGYRVAPREPLIGYYQEHRIVTAPPPSSGGTVLLTTLNILSGAEGDHDRRHLLIESWRRAYRDRGRYIGDPAFVEVPVARLIGMPHADALRATIDSARATPSDSIAPVTSEESGSTTHFSVIDGYGNRVAGTQTINFRYGSGLMPPGTGVVLNNEMFDFAARPGTPDGFQLVSAEVNLVEPGKRPVSSMTPTFIDGPRGVAILGTPGGSRIITMVTLAALAWMDGESPESIVSAPRFHHQYLPDVVTHEPDAEVADLARIGHVLRPAPRRYGNMNIVTYERDGERVTAATDPRNESLVDF